jgi:hypothetical protein
MKCNDKDELAMVPDMLLAMRRKLEKPNLPALWIEVASL